MIAICVDDEPLVLQLTLSLFRDLKQFDQVEGFGGSLEALDWLEKNMDHKLNFLEKEGIKMAVRNAKTVGDLLQTALGPIAPKWLVAGICEVASGAAATARAPGPPQRRLRRLMRR